MKPIFARFVLVAFMAASLAANYRFYWFRTASDPSERLRPSHQQLRAFVERVARTTEPGAAILFQVPPEFDDEGYVPRRFQYLLPSRQVLSELGRTRRQPDYLALWRVGDPAKEGWRLLWRVPDGSLWATVR